MVSRPLGVARHSGMAAGELGIVGQPPLPAHRTADHQLVPRREPAALGRTAGHHHLLLGRLGFLGLLLDRRGGDVRAHLRGLGNATRGIGHLKDRLPHPHHVAQVQRSRGLDALAVHEGPVRRPEILDRQLSALAA